MLRVTAVGWKAAAALARSEGSARVLARLARSTYLGAGGDILWLGPRGSTLHGRAILVEEGSAAGEDLVLDTSAAVRWRPPPVMPSEAATLRNHARALADRLARAALELGPDTPRGFGACLVGAPMREPLDRAGMQLDALARAAGADDAAATASAAAALLGLGPGLTPAGDDLVGGLFFVRRLLAARDAAAWERAGSSIVSRAREATHPISAALLADHVAGESWAPLHELAACLALEAPAPDAVRDVTRRLVGIGHTSGWDVLTGFLVGLLGRSALRPLSGVE